MNPTDEQHCTVFGQVLEQWSKMFEILQLLRMFTIREIMILF